MQGPGQRAALGDSLLLNRALPLFALLPAFIGGATERWGQGITLCLLGVLLCAAPPSRSLGKGLDLLSLALVLCAFSAFLPVQWFAMPLWRKIASEDYSLNLGPCLSPQPWLTAESTILLLGGLAWVYLMCAGRSEFNRRLMLRWFCAGVVVWAGVANLMYQAQIKWPVGNAETSIFGAFPNRNQSANLLAIGLILLIALGCEEFRRRRRSWIAWFAGAALIFWSLVSTGSRAGILLGILGLAIWAAIVAAKRGSIPQLGSALGVLCGVIGIFLYFGNNTLERISVPKKWGADSEGSLRLSIQREALANVTALGGVGLGNFQSVFLVSRQGQETSKRHTVLHPESDWIWCAAEMGWVSVALILLGVGILLFQVLPLGADPDWRLRAAGAAAILIFVLHSFVDVSGHRLGTLFPAIFVGACALPSSFGNKPKHNFWRLGFRSFGVFIFLVGIAWTLAGSLGLELPGKIGVESAVAKSERLNAISGYAKAWEFSGKAIRWAPLDWRLHYQRGVGELLGAADARLAMNDFRLARFLNPANIELPLREGELWVERNPALALPAWEEALSRAGEARKDLYAEMLAKSQNASPGLAKVLETLADGDPALMWVALQASGPDGFDRHLNKLLAKDPSLSSLSVEEQKALFRSWRFLGRQKDFLPKLETHPEWMRVGWAAAADLLASQGEFQRAYELAQGFVKTPALPQTTFVEVPVNDLRQAVLSNPHSYLKGYALYVRQMSAGQEKEALVSLQRLTTTKSCPAYFWFLQARLMAKLGDFKEAWTALARSGLASF